jgi:hypothetical protein
MDQPILVVQIQRSRESAEEELRFVRSPVHIGRGPRNELQIDHAFVSHQHGVLHFDASGVDFIDLGSTNGSLLEGVRVESHRFTVVHNGAQLTMGTARLRVRLDVRSQRGAAIMPNLPVNAGLPTDEGVEATALAAVIECFAASFLALAQEQRAWRERIGLARPRSGLHALADPLSLLGYLLAPGHESSRLEELEIACEELLCNERAIVRAIAEQPYSVEAP